MYELGVWGGRDTIHSITVCVMGIQFLFAALRTSVNDLKSAVCIYFLVTINST